MTTPRNEVHRVHGLIRDLQDREALLGLRVVGIYASSADRLLRNRRERDPLLRVTDTHELKFHVFVGVRAG